MTDNIRPVYGDAEVHHEFAEDDWDTEHPIDPSVGWALSWGCQLTFGQEGDQLQVTVSTSDQDQANGITKRTITREQLADYARKLLALAEGKDMLPMDKALNATHA